MLGAVDGWLLAEADLPPAGGADATRLALALQDSGCAGGAVVADVVLHFFPPVLEDAVHPRLPASQGGVVAVLRRIRHETFLFEKTTNPVAGSISLLKYSVEFNT